MNWKIIIFLLMILMNGRQIIDGLQTERSSSSDKPVVQFRDNAGNVLASGDDLDASSIEARLNNGDLYDVKAKFIDPSLLEEISRKVLGEQLSIYCNDELLSSPIMQQVLTSGEFAIVGFTKDESEKIADLLRRSAE